MPKIIEEVEHKIMDSARKILESKGYDGLTARSVALRAGVSVGTLYNYFSSKEDIAAAVILADWRPFLEKLSKSMEGTEDPLSAAKLMYTGLLSFSEGHANIFNSSAARASINSNALTYHRRLTGRLSELLMAKGVDPVISEVTVEILLIKMHERASFADFEIAVKKLLI